MKYSILFFLGILVFFGMVQCQKFVQPENETVISEHGEDESHNNNTNCMNCHYTEGRGEGWFTVAGTINGNAGNSTVNVYEAFGQAPIASIEVDGRGNFYTTEFIDVSKGLYYSVVDDNGAEHFMSEKIYTGQCALCHGVTTDKLSY